MTQVPGESTTIQLYAVSRAPCNHKSGFSPLIGEQARCEKVSTIADVTSLRGCNCAITLLVSCLI